MTFFKFPCLSRKSQPVVATNSSLDTWCDRSQTRPTRFIKKVEMCTALCSSEDARDAPAIKNHHHTFLRVFLVPDHNDPCASADTLLIERVTSTDGTYHSVTPIAESLLAAGPSFHQTVHDRVCAISRGSQKAFTHHLVVERTVSFKNRPSTLRLTLAEFAQILGLVSRTTKPGFSDEGCRFESRAFAFMSFVALAPSLPPLRAGESTWDECGSEMANDSVLELSAEAHLAQVRQFFRKSAEAEAVGLIEGLKREPRTRAKARLYH